MRIGLFSNVYGNRRLLDKVIDRFLIEDVPEMYLLGNGISGSVDAENLDCLDFLIDFKTRGIRPDLLYMRGDAETRVRDAPGLNPRFSHYLQHLFYTHLSTGYFFTHRFENSAYGDVTTEFDEFNRYCESQEDSSRPHVAFLGSADIPAISILRGGKIEDLAINGEHSLDSRFLYVIKPGSVVNYSCAILDTEKRTFEVKTLF